jgi:hypothetical protein
MPLLDEVVGVSQARRYCWPAYPGLLALCSPPKAIQDGSVLYGFQRPERGKVSRQPYKRVLKAVSRIDCWLSLPY